MTPPVQSKKAAAKNRTSFTSSLTMVERMRLADLKEQKRAIQEENRRAKIEATKQRTFAKLEQQNEAIIAKGRVKPSSAKTGHTETNAEQQQQEPTNPDLAKQQQEPTNPDLAKQQQEPTNPDLAKQQQEAINPDRLEPDSE